MPVFPPIPPQSSSQPTPQAAQPSVPRQKAPPIPQSQRWRPTAEEQVEIEDFVYNLWANAQSKSYIRKAMKKWGEKKQKELQATRPGVVIEMDARTTERYLSRAKSRMIEESGKTKEELRTDSLNFYLAIARDLTADHRSRLQARERIDRLYGLDMPIKVAPTTPDGEQSYKHITDTELDARILEIASKIGPGGAAPDDGGASSPVESESGE